MSRNLTKTAPFMVRWFLDHMKIALDFLQFSVQKIPQTQLEFSCIQKTHKPHLLRRGNTQSFFDAKFKR